jgi:hypothetical protein
LEAAKSEAPAKVVDQPKIKIQDDISFQAAKKSFFEETKQIALTGSTRSAFIIRKNLSCKKTLAKVLKTCNERLMTGIPTAKTEKVTSKSVKTPARGNSQKVKAATELFHQVMDRDPTSKNLFFEYNSKKAPKSLKGNIFSSMQNLHSVPVKPSYVKPKPRLRGLRRNYLITDVEGRKPIQIRQDIEVLNRDFKTTTEYNLTNFGNDKRDKKDFKCKFLKKLFFEKYIE